MNQNITLSQDLKTVAITNENQVSSNIEAGPAKNVKGPVTLSGVPFIVYDPREFEDRSESTWSFCPNCKKVGMSVIKLTSKSCCAILLMIKETTHYCPFCKHELGRRKNSESCC